MGTRRRKSATAAVKAVATALTGVVLAGAALSGCASHAGDGQDRKGGLSSKDVLGEPTQWVEVKPRAITLPTGRTLDGRPAPSSDGPVVLNFWASYCGPCKDEMPMLQRLERSKRVAVVGVSRDTTAAKATKALRAAKVSYPSWLDPKGAFLHSVGDLIPRALPSSLLIEHGKVTAVHVGPFVSWADLNTALGKRLRG